MRTNATEHRHAQPSLPGIDQRTFSKSSSPLGRSLNTSPHVVAQRALGERLSAVAAERAPAALQRREGDASSVEIVQRAVPNAVPLAHKPVADTGGVYAAAAAGDKTFFTAADYPRSKFRFTERTRQAVLKSVNHALGAGGEVTQSTDAASGHLVHAAGLQLDHSPESWDSISGYMNAQNTNAAYSAYPKYTLRDARNYYSDVSNLHPVLGAYNAAAGAAGVAHRAALPVAIGMAAASLAGNWHTLQGHLAEEVDGFSAADQHGVETALNGIAGDIEDATGEYF